MSATKKKTKGGYTAIPVACGWAGAIIKVALSFGGAVRPKLAKKKLEVKCDGRTKRTGRWGVESYSMRLKAYQKVEKSILKRKAY